MPLNDGFLDDDFWVDEATTLYEVLLPIVTQAAAVAAANGIAALGANVAVSWDVINNAARAWAESYSYGLVSGITHTSRAFLQETISEWVVSGEPLPALVRELEASGMFGQVRAQMIAETETTRAFAQGNLIGWRESGTVSGKRWRTSADDLVCDRCGPLEGAEVALHEAFQDGLGEQYDSPPAHVRCRCWIQPIVKAGGE